MNKERIIITLLAITTIVLLILLVDIKSPIEKNSDTNVIPDTIIVKVPFDRVKEKIVKQEVITNQYKKEYEYTKQKANTISDSAAIELFYKLASGE